MAGEESDKKSWEEIEFPKVDVTALLEDSLRAPDPFSVCQGLLLLPSCPRYCSLARATFLDCILK